MKASQVHLDKKYLWLLFLCWMATVGTEWEGPVCTEVESSKRSCILYSAPDSHSNTCTLLIRWHILVNSPQVNGPRKPQYPRTALGSPLQGGTEQSCTQDVLFLKAIASYSHHSQVSGRITVHWSHFLVVLCSLFFKQKHGLLDQPTSQLYHSRALVRTLNTAYSIWHCSHILPRHKWVSTVVFSFHYNTTSKGRYFSNWHNKGQKLCENMADSKCWTHLNLGQKYKIKFTLYTSVLYHELNLQIAFPWLLQGLFFKVFQK